MARVNPSPSIYACQSMHLSMYMYILLTFVIWAALHCLAPQAHAHARVVH